MPVFSENIDALTARIVCRGKGSRVHPADAAGMCGIDCGYVDFGSR